MSEIRYIDRRSKKEMIEKVYGRLFIDLFYGNSWIGTLFFHSLLPLIARCSFFSHLYGKLQKRKASKRKIAPFIKRFEVDTSEFQESPESFNSFNDFFIRKLKDCCRPIAPGHDVAVLPADGRYLVFPDLQKVDGFVVKAKRFTLEQLLEDRSLAKRYEAGSMVIARLCPVDYHRFHFPCSCTPGAPKLINGPLYSVNPIALKRNICFLSQNKRVITELDTKYFGRVLFIEVGATYVGSIRQTFTPSEHYAKGDEKGFFEFGGSSLLLVFEPRTIEFDQDLIDASKRKIEVLGLMGQSLGRSVRIIA